VTRHLLVVGAQRCGTTYLHDQLAAHPQIAMTRPQRPEPKVFLSDELAGRGRDWYVRTYFAHARDEVLLGEKSTSYLEYPEAAARAAALLKEDAGAAEVLLTTSCTAALEMSALLLDLQPGDTVIVPSFTFVSSAVAFARAGAGIKFCDIQPRTLGPDPRHVAELLDDSVRAIVVVHYAGIVCDMDGLREALKGRPDVAVIEDNAHGLFGRWRDQPLGSLGRFATLSFHETKNFVCGEGGALLLNDPEDVDRARVLYDKGTNRHAFMRGQVYKYTWKDTGSSFGLSDVLAAYLLGQLEQREAIQAKRRHLHERYEAALAPHAEELGFSVMRVPEDRRPAHHMYYVLLSHRDRRNDVLELMRKTGVQATFHYQPLHTSEAGRGFAVRATEFPVSQDVSDRLLRMPFYNNLSDPDVDRVVAAFLGAATDTLPDR
jgi:dTDP-4-amino-4,6-dideoxygalactose transaminase